MTLVWQGIDIDRLIASSLKTESDAWLFALTLAPLYFLIKALAAFWGVIVGILTCLLAGHRILRRLQSRQRWLIAGVVTAVIFIGIPFALNHHEEARLAHSYQYSDAAPGPAIAGRAIELQNDSPLLSTWQMPIRCPKACIDLLAFGRAKSVTLSFPGKEDAPNSGPMALTYRLGPSGRGCAGDVLHELCPHLTSETMPEDRVILTIGAVTPKPADAAVILARRLYAKDMHRPGAPPATLTRFVFARYPGLLNIAWRDGGFSLPRNELPLLVSDALDTRLYRDLAGRKVLDGQYYPFR